MFEVAIERTGWGSYNYFLIVLCSMISMAEAGASIVIILVIPLLACDLNLSKHEAISLNAMLSLGMAGGTFLFGTIVDTNGRRGTIGLTLAVIFCATITLAFAQTRLLINMSIFVLGMGLAGNNSILRLYLIECLPMRKRGSCMVILDAMWAVGYVSALGVSWAIFPSVLRAMGKEFKLSSWRVLVGLGGTPSLMMSCMSSLLLQSPRHLLCRRHQEEATSVLQQMYAINSSKHADTFPRTNLSNCIRPDEFLDDGTNGFFKIVQKYFLGTWRRIRELHEPPFKCVTLIAMFVQFLLFPGYIWLALWNAHVVQEVDKVRNGRQTGSNFACSMNMEDVAFDFLRNCGEQNDPRFEFLLIMPLTYLLGESFLAFGIDVIGRRTFLVSGLVGASASFSIIFAENRVSRVMFSTVLLAAYVINRTVTSVLLLENYPTRLRGTMIAFTGILPHLTTFLILMFVRIPCYASAIAVSVLLIGASIVAVPIPDLTRLPMRE